jgi:NhaC family Na+:H+ antiporter
LRLPTEKMKNNSERQDEHIVVNKKLNFWEAMIPVIILMILLAVNINQYGGEMMGQYSNHFILLIGAFIAALVGFYNRTSPGTMLQEIWENLRSVFVPISILFLVGALAGTWLISGVIPAMIYYGLQILNPDIFLPASVVIAAIISLATGSSWTTSATVGIALIGIGEALGIPSGMIAGAVISGAYFGDKMSPLSDTTNLAPAMAGTDLFTHIRYMTITTVPTIIITLIIFGFLSLTLEPSGNTNVGEMLGVIDQTFHISPVLFLVPATVIAMILLIPNRLKSIKPLLALSAGVIMAAIFSVVFQSDVLAKLPGSNIETIFNSILFDTKIETGNAQINDLFSAKGMKGMLWTIYLITAAMIFGGVMDGIGALARITKSLLSMASTVFGLFASTVLSCLGLNLIASDQYLAIVIPGKMFKKAFEDKGLAPENLSRTLEDAGTVTSVLIPWNTCGAYQAGVLGVGVGEYFMYAFFNWLSPIMTLVVAAFGIKIKELVK